MSAMAATYSRELSTRPSRSTRRGASLDEVADLARRRAATLDTTLSVGALVQRTLSRFDDTFGRTSRPADLEGWIRRAMREIVAAEQRGQHRARASSSAQAGARFDLVAVLGGLSAPVRSPALAKQRKVLLRRVSELIGGPECRVVFAMLAEPSLDRVADQLAIAPIDVARLQRRGLQQLQSWLDRDPELTQQLRAATRQPERARTAS